MRMKETKRSGINDGSKLSAAIAAGLVLASIIMVTSPVQAGTSINVTDQCEERIEEGTHVLKTEDHKGSCSFRCDEGDYVTVEVIDLDGRGRVTIVGECNGARADCVNKVRSCEETSGLYLAEESGTGECRFNVNHYNSVDKIFRCKAVSPQGGWQDPPTYAMCVMHTLDAWILGGAIGDGIVEVCYYEGNKVCFEVLGTFYAPEPVPWIITCGTDLVNVVLHEQCAPVNGLGADALCIET